MQITTIALVFIIFVSLPVIAAITIIIVAYRRKKRGEKESSGNDNKKVGDIKDKSEIDK